MRIVRFSKTQDPQLPFVTKDIFSDDGEGNVIYFWWTMINNNQIILDDGDFLIINELGNLFDCIKLTDYNSNPALRYLVKQYAGEEATKNFWDTLSEFNDVDKASIFSESLHPVILAINNSELSMSLELLNNNTPTTDLLTEELKEQLATIISDEISKL